MPSSLTRVLSSASGYSPCLPVSVYGTITCCLNRGFSWQHGISQFMAQRASSSLLGLKEIRIYLDLKPTSLNRLFQQTDDLPSCVPPSLITIPRWYRNINLFSIDYAFRPRLRDRLTLSRLALLRKPWAYGERASHPLYRYSCQHGHLCHLHNLSRDRFCDGTTLSYHCIKYNPKLRYYALAPIHFRRRSTRPVSCYAFFKGWLLLSQPPGCLGIPTSFST